MNPFRYPRPAAVAAFLILFAASAHAEAIFPVNGPGIGVWEYDQPSVALSGSRIHIAFVGYGAGTGDFKLYYAAVEGGADFANTATTRSTVLLTPAVAIDNGAAYTDARHPRIALRTDNELVVLFQAVPAGLAAGEYRLFRARILLANNTVHTQLVSEILGSGSARLPGTLVDPSFRLVTSDNSLRVAYADDDAGNVYFARVGIDNANVVGSPILLSYLASSRGVKPIPRLDLDGYNYSHVVWAANDTDAEPTGIYYSLVRANPSGVLDNLAIGPTQVISANKRWGFPCIIVLAPTSVWVYAFDQPFGLPGLAGAMSFIALNPFAVAHDGNPVNVNNVAASALFFLSSPGGTVLTGEFESYQPEILNDAQGLVHIAGYGYRGGPPNFQGTSGRYFAMGMGSIGANAATATLASLSLFPVYVGTGDVSFGTQIAGDYT
ncbi:MAG: hypothetical protein H6Q84_2069, partial [Deltaproteobacteria bacterium]|nr:hypothetical protein [Deltaproteobacteria bacterium]